MLKRILTGLFVAVVLAGGATVDTAATAAGTPPINYGNSKPLVPPTNAARGAVAGPSEDAATLVAQFLESVKAIVAGDAAYSHSDYAEAAKWYRVAADDHSPLAAFDLGLLYDQGQGVPQDGSASV